MKKKAVVFSLVFIMLFVMFSGCAKESVFMEIDGKSISEGVFVYYLDRVISDPEDYGADKSEEKSILQAAVKCCKSYVASEKFMEKEKISLSMGNKQNIATEVERLWSLYSAYYTRIGVTKPDLTEVISHEYRLKQTVDYYYGPEGLEPIDEMELKETFVDLYVGFKAISVPMSKTNSLGEQVPLTEEEKESLLNTFRAYRTEINEGSKTIDEINVIYNETNDVIVTENLEINVVRFTDPMYSQEFFDALAEISHNKAGIIECGDTLYLVQREKIATTEEDEFYLYRTELIEELKLEEIKEKVNLLADEFEYEYDEETAEKFYENISSSKEKSADTE